MPPRPTRRTVLQAAAGRVGPQARHGAPAQIAVWSRDRSGMTTLERAELHEDHGGLRLGGRVVGVADGRPLEVLYEIACGSDGGTDRLAIVQDHGGERRTLELSRTSEGWRRDGRPTRTLAGCLDVDLGVSPSTNLLPIRRLANGGRDAFDLRAAWVNFPSLEVQPSRQRYERLGERLWRYRNLDTGFAAEITVDRFALPIDYRGVWTRLAALNP